ncbi:vestigial like 4 like isoform X2 [Betta splendens]|uniref:Vestigial like 4 like isoform X2 n=1 Tax=Betta splendens TaxID=158456 RepID=A0A6P7NLC2_BETSP|nr:vestigial like 4 like isoform X2 [Betta splendens]
MSWIKTSGQPHLRSEDRYRHVANDRVRAPTVYPVKRKRVHERGLTLEERRERALSRSVGKAAHRAAPAAAAAPQSPSSSWSPTPSPTSPLPAHVYYAPIMDQPIALIKKPRKDPGGTEEKAKSAAASHIQVRPSVITCVSSSGSPSCRSEVHGGPASAASSGGGGGGGYDHVVEEHFQRSLGADYPKARAQQRLSISVSVDDHFAKALGETWLQIKSKSSSCSSTPPSSPSVTHSPTYSRSPRRSHKEPGGGSSSACGHWPVTKT